MKKDLLFSITDFDCVFYRSSDSSGGQKQNKTSSACRITHHASGAVGKSTTYRSQAQNKKEAFRRLHESKKFKLWLKMEVGAVLDGYAGIEDKVNKMMHGDNLKIEYNK